MYDCLQAENTYLSSTEVSGIVDEAAADLLKQVANLVCTHPCNRCRRRCTRPSPAVQSARLRALRRSDLCRDVLRAKACARG